MRAFLIYLLRLALALITMPVAAEGLKPPATGTAGACSLLADLAADASPTERLYAQGACALKQQHYREAIRLLKSLVEQDPYPVYRADLGRAYLGAQEFELARREFMQALESDPPENARRLLLSFMRMAEQEQVQAKEWFATASLGWMYDSNINAGPVSPEITLFGLPFTLSDSGLPKSDRALHGQFNVVNLKPLSSGLSWQTSLGTDLLRYQTWNQYDTTQLMVESGPQFNLAGGRIGLYLPVGGNRTWLNSAPYTTTRSFTPQLRYALGQSDLLSLGLPFSDRSYASSTAMSYQGNGLTVSWRHAFPNNWVLEPALRYGAENAGDPAFSNRQWGASLALRGNLPGRLRFTAEASYGRAHYVEAEYWADGARRDKRLGYSLSLSRDLAGGYYISLNWSRQRILSNLALYSSEREQMQVQISKTF